MLKRACRALLSRVFKGVLQFPDGSCLTLVLRDDALRYEAPDPSLRTRVPVRFDVETNSVRVGLAAVGALSWEPPAARALAPGEAADLKAKLERFVESKGLPFSLGD